MTRKVDAFNQDGPRRRLKDAEDHVDGSGFSGSIGSQESDDLIRRHGERYIIDCDRLAVDFSQTFNREDRGLIAAAIKLSRPAVKVIGAEPQFAADAQASLRAGKIVQLEPEQVTRTLADGLRTQSVGAINFEHIRQYVDDIVTVSEDEIHETMRRLSADPRTLAEPSGAVAAAAFLFHREQLPATTVNVAVISGGNIEPRVLAELKKE